MYSFKSLIALALVLVLLLTACGQQGQAPSTSPESVPLPESPSSVSEPAPEPVSSEPEPEPAPEESSHPEESSSQPEAQEAPDTSPDYGIESYADAVIKRADPLREALKPALKAIESDYSSFEVLVEDGSLDVVLEIGVIHEDKVSQFLADWTGPSWDQVKKSPGAWSVTEQVAFAAAVANLNLEPGVSIIRVEREENEMVLVTIRPDDDYTDPLAHWDDWHQAVKDFAREQNVPEGMVICMYAPPLNSAGLNPD